MRLCIFRLEGDYAGGLALVSAPSRHEAVSILARANDGCMVDEYPYAEDDGGDLIHPNSEYIYVSTNRKWVFVKDIDTTEPEGVVAMEYYAE